MAKSKLTPRQRDQVVQMYIDGATIAEAGRAYGINTSSVSALMQHRGIKARSHRYPFDQTYFDIINTEEKAYFLGFLYADGYNCKSHYMVRMVLQTKDGYILDRFAKAVNNPDLVYEDRRSNGRVYRGICFNSKRFALACLDKGVLHAKSKTLLFPTSDQVPPNLLHHFMRGYFDGDGWISTGKSCAVAGFISSDAFMQTAQETLSRLLNIVGHLKPHPHSEGMLILTLSSRSKIRAFMEWLYTDATIYLSRKRERYDAYKASFKYRDRLCPNTVLPILTQVSAA